MANHPTCFDCGEEAPHTDTPHTLISAEFGWRLTLERLPDGTAVKEWRCPSCWKRHRAKAQCLVHTQSKVEATTTPSDTATSVSTHGRSK